MASAHLSPILVSSAMVFVLLSTYLTSFEIATEALCIVQIPTPFGFAVVSKFPGRICLGKIRS